MNILSSIPLDFDESINDLVFKSNSSAQFQNKTFVFKKNDFLILDTYYSSFSIGKWKSNTMLENLFFNIVFKGEIRVDIRHIEPGEDIKDFKSVVLRSKHGFEEQSINIGDFSNLNGIFTVEIVALSNASIKKMYWGTLDFPRESTKLAIVITTFNRQEAVLKSIGRVLKNISNVVDYHLFVVDNGSNINLDGLDGSDRITLIYNENFGGAGGFSRGLDEVFKARHYTHCLFMDDDASCLMESIERAYHFVQYAKSDNLAVAGAMLFAEHPTIQHESGAVFNGYCVPLKHNLDLTDLGVLIENERYEHIDYAGWWFFMFPLKYVTQYAYPFFVRGDDSNFSIQHNFNIQTLNGIGCWQESFSYKSSPMTEYLDMRYHLVHKFHIDYLQDDTMDVLRTFWRFINRNNNKYLYESAEACCIAFEDFLKGPDYFAEDLNATQARKKIGDIRKIEFLEPLNGDVKTEFESHFLGGFWKNVRRLTFNGHLVPDFMLDNSSRFVDKRHTVERAFFLAKKVTYVHPETGTGFSVQQSKKKFFTNIAKAAKLSGEYLLKHKRLKRQYKDSYEKMCSPEEWRKRFNANKK